MIHTVVSWVTITSVWLVDNQVHSTMKMEAISSSKMLVSIYTVLWTRRVQYEVDQTELNFFIDLTSFYHLHYIKVRKKGLMFSLQCVLVSVFSYVFHDSFLTAQIFVSNGRVTSNYNFGKFRKASVVVYFESLLHDSSRETEWMHV
jgi:hypothetical protein